MSIAVSNRPVKSNKEINNTKGIPVWEVTFEEETPVWTFGSEVGTKTWVVSDTTPDNGFVFDFDGDGTDDPVPPLWIS